MANNTRRQQRIEQVANCILMHIPEPGDTIESVAQSVNDGESWYFELPVSRNNYLRCEGVKLSQADLQQAIDLARKLIRRN